MPASRVLEEMTEEEILGWSAYFAHLNDQRAKEIEAAKRDRKDRRR